MSGLVLRARLQWGTDTKSLPRGVCILMEAEELDNK